MCVCTHHMHSCTWASVFRLVCDLMGCCVVTSGDEYEQHEASWGLMGIWIWALVKKTVPGTQIRFGRMFGLNGLSVLMVEERSSAYMHVSMWLSRIILYTRSHVCWLFIFKFFLFVTCPLPAVLCFVSYFFLYQHVDLVPNNCCWMLRSSL